MSLPCEFNCFDILRRKYINWKYTHRQRGGPKKGYGKQTKKFTIMEFHL